jgi:hypothetical protein
MDFTGNDLAGVVDLFGALTRAELADALAELAFKRGADHDPGIFKSDIERAERSYHLVAVEAGETAPAESLLVVGPAAFPELAEGATDLPHIMDVEGRDVDRQGAVTAAEKRFREEASVVVEEGDTERMETLLDVSYELEAWGGVDLSAARDRLDGATR